MSKTQINSLSRIQNGIDNLISIHGSESAADLIEAMCLEKNSKAYTFTVNLQKFIEKKVIETFKINKKLLSTSNAEAYKNARKCCFYLLNKHCKISPGAIKKMYPDYLKTYNNISAQIKIMQQIIHLPAIDKQLHEKCMLIESIIVKYKTT